MKTKKQIELPEEVKALPEKEQYQYLLRLSNKALYPYANAGMEDAQLILAERAGLDDYHADTLLRMALKGWKSAQFKVWEGYSTGAYGFEMDNDKAIECSRMWGV